MGATVFFALLPVLALHLRPRLTQIIQNDDPRQCQEVVAARNLWYNKTTKHMRCFACTFDKVLLRFFLMMACVIGGLFAGQPLIAILALPLFLSAILGISFLPEEKTSAANAKSVVMKSGLRDARKAA